MKFYYYPSSNTGYIELQEGVSEGSEVYGQDLTFDYMAETFPKEAPYKSIIGIEIERFSLFDEVQDLREALSSHQMPSEMIDKVIALIENRKGKVMPYKEIIEPLM